MLRSMRVAAPAAHAWLYASTGLMRAPFRVAVFGVSLVLAQGMLSAIIAPMFALMSRAIAEPLPAYPWITLSAVFAAILVSVMFVDDAPWSSVGLERRSWRWQAIGGGVALGAAAITATALVLVATGVLHFESASLSAEPTWSSATWSASTLRMMFVLAPAALWEELVFRGYLWTVAEQAGGARLALWSTSLAFGAMHITNPGAGVRTTALVILAGVCLGTVRQQTHSVPAAWGAHLAWNAVMAVVLHAPVSGLAFGAPGHRAVVSGPDWWTGGAWGPEGGVAGALVLMCMLGLATRRSRVTRGMTQTGGRAPAVAVVTSTARTMFR